MCGLAATYAYRGRPVDRDELRRTRDHMMRRGPDGEGLWISDDGRIGLAHRRLSIIDLSDAAAQPMASSDGRYRIVFNGEIYNYRELRDELEGKGVIFRSTSDTEVLLELYRRHGADMLSRLRGMYAIAIWDSTECELFLSRDPYGIKPLYFSDDGSTIRVASQVKALALHAAVDTSPDPAGHVSFFIWGNVSEPHTIYRGIRALPAGSWMKVTPEGTSGSRPFASISTSLQNAEQAPRHLNGSARDHLRDILLDSVRHHLIADVDVGLFLSSGLDSTTLLALASELGTAPRTLTIGFEEFRGTQNDEVPLAEEIARRYGANHRTIRITREEFRDELDGVIEAMDQPSTDGINSYFVSRAAREDGLKVAISGLGGDELFGGYPSFKEVPLFARWVPRTGVLGKGLRVLGAPVAKRFTSPKYAGLLEYGGSYEGGYLLRRSYYMPWELREVMDRDMAREGWTALDPMSRLRSTHDGIRTPHLRVSALESTWYMRNQLLRDTDWAGMAHSLEVRVPLVDWHVLSAVAPLLAAGVPINKQMMAATPSRPLPDAVLNRAKSGFFVPIRDWMLEGADAAPKARGLRGWAQYVYDRTTSS